MKTSGVLDYLQKGISRENLRKLFTEERGRYVCRAIVQKGLTDIAQQICMRLVAAGSTFPKRDIQVWTKIKINKILEELHQWAIIVDQHAEMIQLTEEFYNAMQTSITSLEMSVWKPLSADQIVSLEKENKEKHIPVTPEDLERYTQQRWDSVLHFLVGSTGKEDPPGAVVHFLLQTGLMQPDPEYNGSQDDAPLVITHSGYDFMLQDNNQQVWHFVTQYLASLEASKGAKLVREALLLLICLSFCRAGEAFAMADLSKSGRVLVKDLALFGLIFTRKIGPVDVFYPTRVAMQLVDSDGDSIVSRFSLSTKALDAALAQPRPHDSSHLGIIVQTNFQLCAYTTSELHVSMLGLFCEVQTIRRLPNIVIMTISRDSVKAAFSLGIKAEQILRFLEKHAHPKLRSNKGGPIPSNVVDQIWLWDRERSRIKFTEVFEHQCLMDGEFRAVGQYAKDHHALAWGSSQQQKLLLKYSKVDRIQAFVRQWRAQQASRD